ncbi:chorion peroxidase [Plakobranchus ocellatus]|uniref:Chorion peroxidase n=1 Tax=Plakobranchus ocellatus TaxID=259542 RepID=A0AAV4D132_9GAST|nr:chorion peroxidase [Plakobranchus ocellatus]
MCPNKIGTSRCPQEELSGRLLPSHSLGAVIHAVKEMVRVHKSLILAACFLTVTAYYHQPTFLEPVYDKYGHEITEDSVLEITALMSTSLGLGFGWNYSQEFYGPLLPPIIPPYLRAYGRNEPRYGQSKGEISNSDTAIASSSTYTNSDGQNTYDRQGGAPSENHPVDKSSDTSQKQYAPFHHRRFKRQANLARRNTADFFNMMHRVDFSSPSGMFLDQLERPPARRELDLNSPASLSSFPSSRIAFPSPSEIRPGSLSNPCPRRQTITCNPSSPYRTVDGLCNNLNNPTWGAALQPLIRMHRENRYHDGLDIPRIASVTDRSKLLPSPRLVSRLVHEPDRDGQEVPELTNMIQQWGQFLDHDITGTPAHKGPDGKDLRCCDNVYLSDERQVHNDVFNKGECNPIYIPPLDRHFHTTCMSFARSQPYPRRQDCDPRAVKEPREQMNMLTAFIDASQMYGSSLKANNLIRFRRHGRMRVTEFNMLPEDFNSTCVKETSYDYCFQSGEMRVNEHPALASMHTVFHRFHNLLATQMARANPRWSDERIFQEVRKIVGAIMQHVTFHEWLPVILGDDVMRSNSLVVSGALDRLRTNWYYDKNVNPTIINAFATAAFRFGHTLIPSTFSVGQQKIRLHRMFNRPRFILEGNGRHIPEFCAGLMEDSVQHFDRYISTDLTDRLFEDRDNVSMDLAALNIQRGRDHGLPSYNEYREVCGLKKIESFEELYLEDADRAEVLRRVYASMDDVDLFTGGISERPLAGAMVGPTFACILSRQFRNLKFGDRFWYESTDRNVGFSDDQLREIKSLSIAKIFCLAAPLDHIIVNPFYKEGSFLPRPVRLVSGEIISQNQYVSCNSLASININYWAFR